MTHPTGGDDSVKELVKQHWNGRAATFDEDPQHGIHSDEQHDCWLSVLRNWTGTDTQCILDVGCGTGVVSLLLAELGHEVMGLDVAGEMLKQARAKARQTEVSVSFQQGDAEQIGLSDSTFEILTARHLIWTLPNPSSALQEWQRVVKPGGQILLIEGYWNHDEPWDEYEEIHAHLPLYHGRPPDVLSDVLADEGFDDVTHEPLMDATLWGRDPHYDYYIMTGTVSR